MQALQILKLLILVQRRTYVANDHKFICVGAKMFVQVQDTATNVVHYGMVDTQGVLADSLICIHKSG